MKNKILLPIILLATLALTGCTFGQQTGSEGSKSEQETSQQESSTPASESESPSDSSSDSEPPVVYGVAINNKAALQAEWHVRESSRDLDIALTPAGNVIQELSKKNLKIESSNSEVVLVNGVSLTAVGEGEATITVTYHEQVDTVALTVLAEKGEPDHVQATVEQILANLEEGKEKDVIYEIEAYVVAWQAGKTDATKYGNYMLADTMEEGAPQILVYGSSANTEAFTLNWTGEAYSYTQGDDAKDFLTNDVTKEVGIGSKLTMEVIAYKYGTTPEVSGIVKAADNSGVIHGNHPEPAVVNATMEEVWANTQGNGAVKFHVTNVKLYSFANNKGEAAGEATKYGNALLGENGEYFAYGLTASATALAWSTDAGMYAFTNPQDFLTNEVTKDLKAGAVVDLDLIRADYNTTKEVTGVITNVVSNGEGGGEENPEPAVVNATMEEVWADEQGNGKVKFSVKGVELHAFATNKGVATENASKYGNALLGNEGQYFAYGLTGTASALAWDGTAGVYKFNNPQDFLTNDVTKDLAAGAIVDLVLIRADYNTTKEVVGVITAVYKDEPATVNATMAEVWADESGNGAVKFHVEGVKLHAFATNKGVATEDASKYGNALLGETGEYFAYGLSGAASALSWDGAAGIFKFKNAQDFLTSDMTKDIVPGVTLDMDLIRCDYSGTKEVCGVVTAVHEAAQAEIAQPVGTFAGSATLADDSSVFVNVALGDTLAFVEVGTLAKVQTTYEFDNHTGLVTITAEGLGTVTAVFDENAKALTEITLDGAAAAYLKNNGEITLNHVVNFWDCNGTTAELQAQFKRRYMSGSWQVDNSNADRFVSYENGVAGSAMQRRGYSGGAVAVNFASDFEAPITVKNVGFWVYNPGASDITLRMWGYKAASFQSNFETGSVTAVAGQWTYCRMGFTEAAIYNFQIADFTNSGVALVFDNISLY